MNIPFHQGVVKLSNEQLTMLALAMILKNVIRTNTGNIVADELATRVGSSFASD